jgi:HK97 family phage prohead protease
MADNETELRRRKAAEMAGHRERRVFAGNIELREAGSGKLGLIGYACRTNVGYDIGDPQRGGFVEEVRSGAFARSLGNSPDVVLVVQHGSALSGLPIARTRSGTLHLSEDQLGLKVDADLSIDDPDVQSLRVKLNRGDLDGAMSFAFFVPPGGDKWSDDMKRRTISQAEISGGDVSLVVHPANPYASAELVARARESAGSRPVLFDATLASASDRERLWLMRNGRAPRPVARVLGSDLERLERLRAGARR